GRATPRSRPAGRKGCVGRARDDGPGRHPGSFDGRRAGRPPVTRRLADAVEPGREPLRPRGPGKESAGGVRTRGRRRGDVGPRPATRPASSRWTHEPTILGRGRDRVLPAKPRARVLARPPDPLPGFSIRGTTPRRLRGNVDPVRTGAAFLQPRRLSRRR